MLMIRLARYGKNKKPSYRLIVSEKARDTQGTYLEALGWYNPLTNPVTADLKGDRIKYWISKGAKASATVNNLLVDQNIITTPKVKVSRGKKKRAEAKATEAAKADAGKAEAAKTEEKKEEKPVEAKKE